MIFKIVSAGGCSGNPAGVILGIGRIAEIMRPASVRYREA